MIAKKDLVHGTYYTGRCRNTSVARWNANIQRFVYWRTKFFETFLEEICHPDDDKVFDVFIVENVCNTPEKEIPLI